MTKSEFDFQLEVFKRQSKRWVAACIMTVGLNFVLFACWAFYSRYNLGQSSVMTWDFVPFAFWIVSCIALILVAKANIKRYAPKCLCCHASIVPRDLGDSSETCPKCDAMLFDDRDGEIDATENVNRATGPQARRKESIFLIVFGLITVVGGILLGHSGWSGNRLPERSDLLTASGRVAWVERSRQDITFAFEGNSRHYAYSTISGGPDLVQRSLLRRDRPIVEIFFEGPGEDKFPTRPVYEVWVAGEPIRTYEQVRAAWARNDRLGIWCCGFFIVAGFLLSITGTVTHREKSRPER